MKSKNKTPKPALSRSSGILMHITSLPGPYGVGDMGSEARKFADFLARTGQSYWQLLPLNPTGEATGHSPYSSISSFAGNTLLISSDDLVAEGLLKKTDTQQIRKTASAKADFKSALKARSVLHHKACENFKATASKKENQSFSGFCEREKNWLDDFAIYVSIKNKFNGSPWYKWPGPLKDRDPSALMQFAKSHKDEIEKAKWLQHIFFLQWQRLRTYCNAAGVHLFGDLPFYVSYDSADVWSHRDIFSIDKAGKMELVAGVPPDYFNADGQLWGMPVFRWDVLQRQKFSWWVQRIRKNTELFDLLRLDHFRAFAEYWAVPVSEKTARNGTWKKGPGTNLFVALQKALGNLPFVAEDLGDIDESVHGLRTAFHLPGMKVLQFAFGENFPESEYLPHHHEKDFVVYTGTHDNNTSKGWWRVDAGKTEREHLKQYVGSKIQNATIHRILLKLAFASVSRIAIAPMQDILGLDEKARMNAPATVEKNWLWRMKPGMITRSLEQWLTGITHAFDRTGNQR
jgi:4-alpha-glucanotransferase